MDRRFSFVFGIYVTTFAILAQGPGGGGGGGRAGRFGAAPQGTQQQNTQQKPGAIRGTVVSSTGEALRKAEVSIRSGGPRGGGAVGFAPQGGPGSAMSRTTDAAGAFAFENVPPGNYVISAQKAGYVRTDYSSRGASANGTGRSAATPVTVTSGNDVSGITLRMSPQAVVAGRVTDEDGDPYMHASVQIVRERWINGKRQFLPVNGDSTDDRGEYRISGLMPGRYFVMVTSGRSIGAIDTAPRPSGDGSGDTNYTTQYYPGVGELNQASPVQLNAGQEMSGVDFRMRKSATWRVRGRVVDETGKPAMYASVMAMPSDSIYQGVRSMGMVRNQEGTFEIAGLTPGSYTLVVNRGGRDQQRSVARQTIQVGNRDLDGVVLQLQKAFEVSGIVRFEGDSPAPLSGASRIVIDSLEQGMQSNGQVKPDGTWQADSVAPGRYRIYLSPVPDGTYVKAILAGGQDISSGAQISAAATGIEVVLGTKAPEVTGTVLGPDKQPLTTGATVVLIPDESRREQPWLFRSSSVGDGGTFSFRNLAPGKYTVFAAAEIEDGFWFSPEFTQAMQGKGTEVKLEAGASETVQVPLAQ